MSNTTNRILIPRETHSLESLKFAQDFKFKDDDVVTVPVGLWTLFPFLQSVQIRLEEKI
uniref:Uncharacterized protein n=1 Tax=Oryzias sinensis TaxID=183150 RepID=A0A8C7WVU7_9TELE